MPVVRYHRTPHADDAADFTWEPLDSHGRAHAIYLILVFLRKTNWHHVFFFKTILFRTKEKKKTVVQYH